MPSHEDYTNDFMDAMYLNNSFKNKNQMEIIEEKKRGRKALTPEQKELNKSLKENPIKNDEMFKEITDCITEVVTLLKGVHKLKPSEVTKIKEQLQKGIDSIDKVIASNKDKAKKELEVKKIELEKTKDEIKKLEAILK